ncbi:4-hydroxy-tetrahydrodipicolinate reductase [Coxiella-like endosymbiont]|uniref:4-hydroxy-tetrahydrodipicolinate reductase n=1 Tax=Coxiella-like endosymbiont TaxID=1592897 RepID=UPI002729D9C6|nr:4-hydroxy-tetrahydrodipicolinate reductase [Coxiella-like endosymbiont]
MINVIVNGINGKMGQVLKESITAQSDLNLVAGTGRQDNLTEIIKATEADVVIDFTTPHAVFTNTETIINAGARLVVGTTGLTLEQIGILSKQCQVKKIGGIIAPNFSLGAILMMKYARDATHYFPDAEIIEMHHPHKMDAPSGTAIKTAQMMSEVDASSQGAKEEAPPNHARGVLKNNVPIHSIRLPGLFSHQSVIFGRNGETLTIRHDGTDRSCTMPGVFLACRKVMDLDHLVYGLENIL